MRFKGNGSNVLISLRLQCKAKKFNMDAMLFFKMALKRIHIEIKKIVSKCLAAWIIVRTFPYWTWPILRWGQCRIIHICKVGSCLRPRAVANDTLYIKKWWAKKRTQNFSEPQVFQRLRVHACLYPVLTEVHIFYKYIQIIFCWWKRAKTLYGLFFTFWPFFHRSYFSLAWHPTISGQ